MYCIYRITNLINGKTYIGQHKYLDEAEPMKGYKGSGVVLKKAYKKHGFKNFAIDVLYSRIRDKETIDAMEVWAISKFKPEYNIAKGGQGGYMGKYDDPIYRKRLSIANTGKKHSLEARKRMSEAAKGKKRKPFSEEHKRKLSESRNTKEYYHLKELGLVKSWNEFQVQKARQLKEKMTY